ncbi:MAG: acetyl-CoA carboxylase, biotin carboxyl carrier protein [Ruminococcus sp.]|nr:acetyl-CoA carboxylase, biotin carboxyl carrier protein [Ruminococcus sp.]
MKEADIRKYAELMKELGLTGLEITDDDSKVRLERTVTVAAEPVKTVQVETADTTAPAASSGDCYSVKSELVGIFYSAPAENAEPYVSLGDHVRKGQTLCVIEAMKLMNEIVAEEDGTVAEICVTNKQVVEYGTELFKIRRQA